MMGWYVSRDGKEEGPFTDAELSAYVESGTLKPTDWVWRQGFLKWVQAREVPGLFTPPPVSTDWPGKGIANKTSLSGEKTIVATSVENQPGDELQQDASENMPNGVPPSLNDATGAVIKKKNGYFIRHWRGDLPLGVSYWINLILLTVIIQVFISMLAAYMGAPDSPRLVAAVLIGVWILVAPLSIWQFVGVWRSAGKHPSKWAIVAKFLIVIGVIRFGTIMFTRAIPQISENFKIALGTDAVGKYHLRVLRNGTELEFSGAVNFGLTSDVKKILDADPSIKIIHLNSPGGRVGEARKLRDLIAARKLTTYTATGCYSACVLAFTAGQERLINPSARLGFHQYSFPGLTQADLASQYIKDKKYMESRGISASFLDKAFETPSNQLWKPTLQELYEAHVITGYPKAGQVALSGISPGQMSKLEQTLNQIPLYAALKKSDPETYKDVITAFREGFAKGESQADLNGQIHPLIQKVMFSKLPYASAQSIFEFTRVFLDESKNICSKDTDSCFQFMFAKPSKGLDVSRYLPAEVKSRELKAAADIIASASAEKHKRPSDAEVKPLMVQAFSQLALKYGTDVKMLAEPDSPNIDKAKVAAMTIDLYEIILSMPEQQSELLLRYMFGGFAK